jgi:Trk-type K+ transport system membrane component
MPLWLDLLKTPMAAPETRDLRTMRKTMQLLCVACAIGVLAISPLVRLFGPTASFVVAVLLITTALHVALYVLRKNRADNAHFAAMTAEEG